MPLAHRAEQAGPEETRGLLEELWQATNAGSYWNGYTFRQFLDINTPDAHLAAAMMLARDYRRVEFGWYEGGGGWAYLHTAQDEVFEAEAATPALALIAAIAKLHET